MFKATLLAGEAVQSCVNPATTAQLDAWLFPRDHALSLHSAVGVLLTTAQPTSGGSGAPRESDT